MGRTRSGADVIPLEPQAAVHLYRTALATLLRMRIPFLVGGGYGFRHYTGIERYTKDLDLFVRPRDVHAVLGVLKPVGRGAELVFPHWLGKVYGDDAFVDIIFSSGNGVATVDDEWFEHAQDGSVLGLPVRICPAEETLWSKAFVAERERYDGADVAHLIRACGPDLDWSRLVRRFGDQHWRVLLSHLVLFGFIYPGERERVPAWVMSALMRRLSGELVGEAGGPPVCQGTLLSREQYLHDVERLDLRDARLDPPARMTSDDLALWTNAIGAAAGHAEDRREHRRRR
jgi:hypothetical protein